MLDIGSNIGMDHIEQPTVTLVNYINYNCRVHYRSDTRGKLVYIGNIKLTRHILLLAG